MLLFRSVGNNGEGGPPDANTFSSDANANLNSRADRSNVVLINHMANQVPSDYQGYEDQGGTNMTYAQKEAMARATVLANAPCYNATTDSDATGDICYATMMRLAYLNQQQDIGSILLRDSELCLTVEELNQMSNQQIAQNHPLNCAKLNAKPFPYFDGGIMFLRSFGFFSFFSSRNNNLSNRGQAGVICVGPDCVPDASTGVLQDQNPEVSSLTVSRSATSTCVDTASNGDGANNNGATSCIVAGEFANANILTEDTFSKQEADNDSNGDCPIYYLYICN